MKIKIESNKYAYKEWAKTVTKVTNKNNGYAFVGNFVNLNEEMDVDINTFLLHFAITGMTREKPTTVILYKATENGLEIVYKREDIKNKGWAMAVRDNIAYHVGSAPNPTFAKLSDDSLRYELEDRGYIVTPGGEISEEDMKTLVKKLVEKNKNRENFFKAILFLNGITDEEICNKSAEFCSRMNSYDVVREAKNMESKK